MNYADRNILIAPFARVANKVNWRFGREYQCNNHNSDDLKKVLKPGMIILSHKNFELTNVFIKGYWTHTAIVISDDEVVEATGKGVHKKTIEQLITTIDDYIILKPLFCDEYAMQKASSYVADVVGYPYNFSFRQYTRSFYCSELIYWAYFRSITSNGNNNKYYQTITEFLGEKIIMPQHFTETKSLWKAVNCC
ncbi:MAG: hypothetical protein K8R41_06510 [Bacteroidales bacterium]|nr:hypothetical protein [Bacteroidales bacterium]